MSAARKEAASQLSWGETMWIAKERPVLGVIAALQPEADPARLPLFLIPSLPQLSTDYLALAEMADPAQPLFALYLPSEMRKPGRATSVENLARYYADAIGQFRPEGPLALGGWSAGALIAEATADYLMERGRDVRLLAILDGALPGLKLPPRNIAARLKLLLFMLTRLTKDFFSLLVSVTRHLRAKPGHYSLARLLRPAWRHSPFRLFWASCFSALRHKAGFTVRPEARIRPAEIAETIVSLPPLHRAFCFKLFDDSAAWCPGKIYPGPVLVFEATQQPARALAQVAEKWRVVAPQCRVITIQGSHMSIIRPPDGIKLAQDLCSALGTVEIRE
jgi:thioesterase domain-containing protein